jgi:predicted nucleotidyltransferase
VKVHWLQVAQKWSKVYEKYYDTITYYSNSLSDDQKIMLSEQYFSINNEQHHINSFKRDNWKLVLAHQSSNLIF